MTAFPDALTRLFGLIDILPIGPRYNIAPTQQVLAACRLNPEHDRQLARFRWGLIPETRLPYRMGMWTSAETGKAWQGPMCYFRRCSCGGTIMHMGGNPVDLRPWLPERVVTLPPR
jgi:putative SOS response-associated peptidase YedK